MFLSIVIPVYNSEKYLEECLQSCLNQNVDKSQYEIICVDDGSTDNSAEILLNYEKKYDNVVVINQSNKGASTARNNGFEAAKGKYVWFVDSDDFITENFIAELFENFSEDSYDMILFGAYAFGSSLSVNEKAQYKEGVLNPNQAIQSVYITRRLIKRDYLKLHSINFCEKITYGEDALFDYVIYANGPNVAIFERLGYFYRIHSGSLMREKSYESKIKFINSHLTAIEIVKSFYDKEQKKRFRSIKYILDDVQSIIDVISVFDFEDARDEIIKLQNIRILPVKKHERFSVKDIIITIYTNIMCCMYSVLIHCATNKIGFCLLKYESKLMNGKLMKKILRFFKKKYSHLSKD